MKKQNKTKHKPNSFWLFWQHCLRLSGIAWNSFSQQPWKSKSLFLIIFWLSRSRDPLQPQVGTSCWNPQGRRLVNWVVLPLRSSQLLLKPPVFPLPTSFPGTQWLHSSWGCALCQTPYGNVPNTEYISNHACFTSCPFRVHLGEGLASFYVYVKMFIIKVIMLNTLPILGIIIMAFN